MSEEKNQKISKRQYWQDQIKKWQASHLSQSAFCNQTGIKFSTFSYWRSVLSPDRKINQFAAIKVINEDVPMKRNRSIKIKLSTGHLVYIPLEMGINEIAKLIDLLGLPHA
jgi:hypothetical protein